MTQLETPKQKNQNKKKKKKKKKKQSGRTKITPASEFRQNLQLRHSKRKGKQMDRPAAAPTKPQARKTAKGGERGATKEITEKYKPTREGKKTDNPIAIEISGHRGIT